MSIQIRHFQYKKIVTVHQHMKLSVISINIFTYNNKKMLNKITSKYLINQITNYIKTISKKCSY